jgi:hypothetical protein
MCFPEKNVPKSCRAAATHRAYTIETLAAGVAARVNGLIRKSRQQKTTDAGCNHD